MNIFRPGLSLAIVATFVVSLIAGPICYRVLEILYKPAPDEFHAFNVLTLQDGRQINVSRFEVNNAQWRLCAEEGHCRSLNKNARRKSDHPVTKVSWFDAQDYISWINTKTGTLLRLPTLAESPFKKADICPACAS